MSGELELYNRHLAHLRSTVARLDTVDDAKELADKAAAAQTWAKRAKLGQESVDYAAEVKLRAERRAGELIAANPAYGRGKKSLTVSDLGIDDNQATRWQDLARLGDEEFDQAIDEAKSEGHVSTRGVLRRAKRRVPDPPKPTEVAMPKGRYRCIVIDPPWPVQKIVRDVRPQTRVLDYPTMTLDEIAELPIADLYGFASTQGLTSWLLGDLNAFRIWHARQLFRHHGVPPGIRIPNRDGSSAFQVYTISDLPTAFTIARLPAQTRAA